jgi:hypothetical protein
VDEEGQASLAWQLAVSVIVTHVLAERLRKGGDPATVGRQMLSAWVETADRLDLSTLRRSRSEGSTVKALVKARLEKLVAEATRLAEQDESLRRRAHH